MDHEEDSIFFVSSSCVRAFLVIVDSRLQWQRDPSTLAERALDRVDHFLDPGAVAEVSFVLLATDQNLDDEAADQIRVEQGAPRFVAAAARRIAARGNLELAELHLFRRGRPERFADTGFLDEAADE